MTDEEKAKAPRVYKPCSFPVTGKRLEDIQDPKWLRKQVERLFSLLDDIETLGEVFPEDHAGFRQGVQEIIRKRHQVLVTDGFELMRPDEGVANESA